MKSACLSLEMGIYCTAWSVSSTSLLSLGRRDYLPVLYWKT
jgi:hypothetical protein